MLVPENLFGNFPEVNKLGKPPEYIFLVLYGIRFLIICLGLLSWFG